MSRLQLMDGAITDLTKPTLVTLESLEAQITALTPRAWWDASNPAYRIDVSSAASQLTDRTGNGFHLQQATPANRPPVAANAWGALNGVNRDAVTFDHVTDYKMASAGNVFDATTIWTMVFICRAQDSGTVAIPFSLTTGSNRFELDLQVGGLTWRANGQSSTVVTAATGNVMVIMTYNYPGSGNVTENLYVTDLGGATATRSTTYALGTTSPATNGLTLGRLASTGGLAFKGGISELLALKADISGAPTTLALFKQYFQMKYRTA